MRITLRLVIFNLTMLTSIVLFSCAAPENQEPSENIVVTDINAIQIPRSPVTKDLGQQSTTSNEKTGNIEQFGISVTGLGSASSKPDLSEINLGVETRAPSVESARSKAASAMTKVLKRELQILESC